MISMLKLREGKIILAVSYVSKIDLFLFGSIIWQESMLNKTIPE